MSVKVTEWKSVLCGVYWGQMEHIQSSKISQNDVFYINSMANQPMNSHFSSILL
jgi:hypothetical protein